MEDQRRHTVATLQSGWADIEKNHEGGEGSPPSHFGDIFF